MEAEGHTVKTFEDGSAALEFISATPPDLVVSDIKMPTMDGMELLRRIRQESALPLIFLTSKDEEIDEVLGLTMGADDYVKKPFSQRLLMERVKAVLRRGQAADPSIPEEEKKVLKRGSLTLDPFRHACSWKGAPVTLTVTEFLILQALAQRPGFVKSRDQFMWTTEPSTATLSGSGKNFGRSTLISTLSKPSTALDTNIRKISRAWRMRAAGCGNAAQAWPYRA
jgi:two-component system response regulator ChvI